MGFGGTITYERSINIRSLLKFAPEESFVVETDSPDMNPSWLGKGAENSPKNIVRIFDFVAELRNQNKEDISIDVLQKYAKAVSKNIMKGSYGSSRAYEIKISSGGEVHNLHVNEWGLLKILKLFYVTRFYTMQPGFFCFS